MEASKELGETWCCYWAWSPPQTSWAYLSDHLAHKAELCEYISQSHSLGNPAILHQSFGELYLLSNASMPACRVQFQKWAKQYNCGTYDTLPKQPSDGVMTKSSVWIQPSRLLLPTFLNFWKGLIVNFQTIWFLNCSRFRTLYETIKTSFDIRNLNVQMC